MGDDLTQAYARLSVHEFAIEVMMANWLASLPEAQAEQFLEDYANKSRSAWTTGKLDAEDKVLDQILQDMRQITDHFLDKVRRRAAGIRGHSDEGGHAPQ